MAIYGYARVSVFDQNLGIQRAALEAAGCDVIRAEKASRTRRDGRADLRVLLDFLRPGDSLFVTHIDRLARSLRDLQSIVHRLKERRVTLRAIELCNQPRGVRSHCSVLANSHTLLKDIDAVRNLVAVHRSNCQTKGQTNRQVTESVHVQPCRRALGWEIDVASRIGDRACGLVAGN